MNETLLALDSERIINLLKQGKRPDGRKMDEYRKISIQNHISENADGSARVKLGETDVVVGVKMVPDKPYPDSPDQGTISVGAELLALASPEFEWGPPREDAIELARVVDRGIRESKAIDFNDLCITEGELVWVVFIDGYVLNYDGNLFDACGIAALSALLETKIPKLEEKKIVKKEYAGRLKMARKPILCTFAKIGSTIVTDPNLAEDSCLNARLSIATTEDDHICAMQKGSGGSFTSEEVLHLVDLAFAKGKELRKLL